MRKVSRGRSIMRRTVLLSLVAVTLLGVVVAAFFPALEQQVSAAGSGVNLPERGKKINLRQNRDIAYGTCEPYWDKTVKTRDFLQQQFYPKMDDLPYEAKDNQKDEWDWLVNEYDERTIESRIGHDFGDQQVFGDDQPKIDRAARMLQLMGKQEVPIIRFRASASGTQPLDGTYAGNGGICGNYVMIPVDYPLANNRAGSWRGFEVLNDEVGAYNPDRARGEYMEFKMSANTTNAGSFTYYGKANGGELVTKFENRTLIIDGTYPSGAGNGNVPNVGTINASWVDASTLHIDNSRQNFAGEDYRKRSWNTRFANGTAYSYYFLDKASPGRENLTWSNNSKKCEEALPLNTACGGGGICVPFIALKQQLNVDHNNFGRLQNDINQLGGAAAELYDFNSSCVPNARYTVALNARDNSQIWLYYSSSQKAFMPVFTTGDGNEVKYIGTYGQTKEPNVGPSGGTSGEYRLGQCMATIAANPLQMGANETFGVSWTLTDGNCAALRTYGTLNVRAKGGAAGETAFGANQQEAQDTQDAGASEAKFICSLSTGGVLSFNWIFCPLTRLALEGVEALEAIINDTLTLKTDRIFNDQFYKAWAGFRTLALALIAIAALIMVISQAAGVEILDAYTIKKVLPRLLFAAIAITVSWAVMQFLVTLSNDVGSGIRYLIYSPFPNNTNLGGVAFTGFLVALLSSGALLALGLLGMLSFILTALLAAAVAFVIIVFRELLVMFLVMSAPFAIACYILPNTQKVWEMWKNAFIAALLVFAIITTFIALGRVFAIVAINSGGNETLNQIIAIIAYILPYFLITTAFRMAGGVMATVGGLINDRTKGGFDRLRNFRQNQREDRAHRFKEGKLYDSNNLLFRPGRRGPLGWYANKANQIGERKNLGMKRGFGYGERGRQAAAMQSFIEAEEERKKNPWIDAISNTDDAGMLVLAASGGNARRAKQFADARVAAGKWTSQQANEAYNSAMAVGVNRTSSIAALQKLAENKSREVDPGDIATIRQAIADVSEGNTVLADKLSWDFQYRSRTAGGRADLGGVWHTPGKRAEAQSLAAAMSAGGATTGFNGKTLSSSQDVLNDASGVVAYFDGADRTSVQQALAGHPSEITALSHAVKTAFKYGTNEQKEKAALLSYEIHKGLAAGQASAENRQRVSAFLSEIGADSGAIAQANTSLPAGSTPITVESVLAAKVGKDPLAARNINGDKILDAAGNDTHNDYTAAMLSARARAFDAQAQRGNMMAGD